MLNMDLDFKNLAIDELDQWLKEAAQAKYDAYEQDNIREANQIGLMMDIVEHIKRRKMTPNAIGESFSVYSSKKNINEHTETGNTVGLFEVDENLILLKNNLPDLDVDAEVTGTIENGILVSLDPIVVDIAFELKYLDEPEQHITLTYSTADNISINLSSIPKADYSTMEMGGETIVSFKNLTHLADECEAEFSETVEWPFEIKFKSTTAANKYNKATSIAEKITLLLGKDKLINKVDDYKSTHQKGSNQATRQSAREEAERQMIRRRVVATAGKTKSQILQELLEQIPGVASVTVSDSNNAIYYKNFRVRINNGNKMYEILMGRTLTPEEIADGKRPFVCRPLGDQLRAQAFDTRDEVVDWLENTIRAVEQQAATAGLTPRERQELRLRAARGEL